jgi:hypothetical protein
MKKFILGLILVLSVSIAKAQTSYQISGLCHNGICTTQIPSETLDVYITSNDSNGVPYQIGVYTAPTYSLTDTLVVDVNGRFVSCCSSGVSGTLSNVSITTTVHKQGRFETKTVLFTATVMFN